MERSLLIILALFIFIFLPNQNLQAQCASGGGTCADAPSVPCGSISGTLDDIPPAGAVFPGCPGWSIDNPHWWAIQIFTGGNITVSVTPSNCQGSGSGGGLGAQAGLYQDCDPNSANFGVQCACTTGGMVFSSNLAPGTYYVMIDGCAADVCDYTIDVIPPQNTVPVQQPQTPIADNLAPCPGEIVNLFLPAPVPGATNYIWSFPPGVTPIGAPPYCTQVSVTWGANSGCIDVTAANDCSIPSTSIPICLDVPHPEGTEYGQYCFPSEPGWYHAGTQTFYPTSIDIPWITDRNCDSTIHLIITQYSDGFNFVFEQICEGEETCNIAGHIFDSAIDTTILLEGWAAGGCDSTIQINVTELSAEVTLDAPQNLDCQNVSQGVPVTASGTADASYAWSTNGGNIVSQPSDDQIIVDAPGWYIVEIEVNGVSGECNSTPICTAIDSIEVIADFNAAVLTPASVDVSCGGESDGSAAVSVNPGTGEAPFSYVWDPGGSTSSSINNLPAGTYTVTVTGNNGCTTVESIVVNEPPPVVLTLVGTTDASCNGGLDGSATVSASGGTPAYNYVWPASAGNQTGPTATNLASGSYIVTVSDDNGCTETLTVAVSEPTTVSVIDASTPTSCNGGSDGSASVSVSGGTLPYLYLWDPSGSTTSSINNVPAGSYSVTITDGSGCNDIRTIDVLEPTAVAATHTVSDALCNGSSDGSATLTPSGGTPPYSYFWPVSAGNQTTATATNLAVGNYAPTISDGNGCTYVASVDISEPTAVMVVEDSNSDVSCNGGDDGSASITASGGTAPYTYSWSGGQTSASPTNLPAGPHTVIVTDANGCTSTLNVTINEPAPVTLVEDTNTPASCFGIDDGAASVIAGGGVPPYSYNWSGSSQTGPSVDDLAAGSHTVTVTDAYGCTETLDITITQPNILGLSLDATTPASCNGASDGSATVSGTGGTAPYTYDWNSGAASGPTNNSLSAGQHTVVVTDASGCTFEINVDITEPIPVVVMELSTADPSCNGDSNGSAEVDASGGTFPYTYDWGISTGASVNNLPAGTHTVTVTDDSGCTVTYDVVLNEPDVLGLDIDNISDVGCNGDTDGSASVSATGGTTPYEYTWPPGGSNGNSQSNLAAGIYTVTVRDDNGCTETVDVTIDEPVAIVLTEQSVTDVSCFGETDGEASVSTTGGSAPYSYDWSDGNGNGSSATDLPAGTVTVTVTDDNGCTEEISINIAEPTELLFSVDNIQDVSCNGGDDGSASVSASGGTAPYDFEWDDGNNQTSATANNLEAGTYTVIITDDSGCTVETTVTIDGPIPVVVTEDATTDPSCSGDADGSATVSASGGVAPYTYDWSNGASGASVNNLTGTDHTVTVTDDNGCTQTLDISLSDPTAVALNIDDQSDALCNGTSDGTASLSANGGTAPYTFDWPGGASGAAQNNLAAGTYIPTVTDDNGCSQTIEVVIDEPAAIILAEQSAVDVSCNSGNDGSASVSASGGSAPFSYAWSSGTGNGASVSDLSAGTVTVTVTDDNSCTEEISITIDEPPVLQLAVDNSQDVNCNAGSDGTASVIATGGTPPYSFQWDDPSSQSSSTASNLPEGTYTPTVTDANGCTAEATVTIAQPTELMASADGTDALCNGSSDGSINVDVQGGTPPYSYAWNNSLSPIEDQANVPAGSYNVTITDDNGCTVVTGMVIDEPTVINATASTTIAGCGVNDGTISLTVNGGTQPYTFDWDNSAADVQNPDDLFAGIYNVTITDANGCTFTTSATIDNPPSPTVTSSFVDVNCFGGADGIVDLEVAGGSPPYDYNWSPALSNVPDHNTLTAGTYDVTITDSRNCTVTESITITQPAEPVAIALDDLVQATCGLANGSISISASGGTPPYQYAWSGGSSTSPNNPGLVPGLYTVTVTDANGCSEEQEFNVSEPNALQFDGITASDVLCNGGSDGSITIAMMGGSMPYSYLWNYQDSPNQNLMNIPAGTYELTVTDVDGCTVATQVTIAEPDALTASADPSIASCGEADGSISLTVNGGTQPYTFQWDNGAGTAEDPTNLAANTYTVIITDANGCTFTLSTDVVNPNTPQVSFSSSDVNCNGGNDGTISLAVTGGTPPFSYNWSPALSNAPDHNAVSAGIYNVTITDSRNCSTTETITIVEPAEPVAIALDNLVQATCGAANGSVAITASGGTPPYSYAWSNMGGPNSPTNTGLTPGIYTVTVTDANDCTLEQDFNVSEPNALQFDGITPSDVLCNGGSDGSIDVEMTGGSMPYIYQWDYQDSTSQDLMNIPAGDYILTVTDGDGCTVSTQVTIAEPDAITASADPSIASCGEADGSISLTVNGGTPPFTFAWTNGAGTNEDPVNLVAGTYDVVITDANGCTFTLSTEVINPNSPQLSFNATDVNCNGGIDGTIGLQVTGGTGPFSYTWNPSLSDDPNQMVSAGTYDVTVTDSQNCSDTETITIGEPTALQLDLIDVVQAVCGEPNGSVSTMTTGGTPPYSYAWSGNVSTTPDATGLYPGVYIITVTDANGCTISDSYNVTEPNALQATETHTDVSCNGGNDAFIDVNPTGGTAPYTFNWSNGTSDEDAIDLGADTYTVIITDSDGCTFSLSVEITEPTPIDITGTSQDATCNFANGSISLTVTGGTPPYSYDWTDPTVPDVEDPQNLFAGTYDVIVTDANGCTEEYEIAVVTPNGLQVSVLASDANCFGDANGAVTSTVQGGIPPYTYAWSNGASTPNISDLPFGSYVLTVTDADGCTVTASDDVDQPAPLVAEVIAPLDASCNGSADGSIDLNVTGGTGPYTYLWNNGAGTQEDPTGLPAGTYIVTVTDANGCTTTEEGIINEPTVLQASAVATDANCNSAADGSINATVLGGTPPYTYSWSNGAGTVEDPVNLPAGTYTLEVTDANGCVMTTSATVGQPSAINITLVDESDNNGFNITCSDASDGFAQVVAIGGTPPYSYTWDNGASGDLIDNLTAGVYTVIATDANGCTQELAVNMTAPLPIAVDAQVVDPTCFGDGNGFIFIEDVSGGAGPYVYSFNGGPFSAQPQLTNLDGGSYDVVVQDANGCEWSEAVQITEPGQLLVNLGDDIEIAFGDSTVLQPNANAVNFDFTWIQGDAFVDTTRQSYQPWVMPLITTVYEIQITDEDGCRASDLLTVFVSKERPIYIPNAFSPNGDGLNDFFQIFAREGIVKNVNKFIVFDRWGEIVFERNNFVPTNQTDLDNGWDGSFRGEFLNPAVFVYYAEIEFIDGWVELYKGDVTLVASQGK